MKVVFLLTFLACGLFVGNHALSIFEKQIILSKGLSRAIFEAVVNEYTDKVLSNVDNLILDNNFDPLGLDDVTKSFEYRPLGIPFKGELDLTNGHFQGLSTFKRNGNSVVSYNNDTDVLTLGIPIVLASSEVEYDYKATIMSLGPSGIVDGSISDIKVNLEIEFNFHSFNFSLSQFEIEDTGHVKVIFHGNALIDWLLDILSNLMTTILKDLIVGIMESVIEDTLLEVFEAVNDAIHAVTPPENVPAFFEGQIKPHLPTRIKINEKILSEIYKN